MSAGGSYLNSSVSLISKASIRYEGTLYSINPQEATITLSKVKSYGTEDRKVEKFLLPKETLFEYIIFKANDIKELIVDEPLDDPAIVTAHIPTSSNNAGFSGYGENSGLQANNLNTEQNPLNNIGQANAPSISSAGQTNDRLKSRGTTPTSQAISPASELSPNRHKQDNKQNKQNNYQQNGRQHHMNNRNHNNSNNNNNQRRNYDNNRQRVNYHQQNNNMNRRGQYHQNNFYHQNNNLNRRNQYPNNYSNQQRGQGFQRYQDNRNGYRNNQYNQHKRFVHNGSGKVEPLNAQRKKDIEEYDFEKANEEFITKFDSLNISQNGEKTTEDKTETTLEDKNQDEINFYDKAKSFFDKISCESAERNKPESQKIDWKQERKINQETFGVKITYRRNDGNYRRPAFLNNGRNYQQRRYNNGYNPNQRPPRTNTSS